MTVEEELIDEIAAALRDVLAATPEVEDPNVDAESVFRDLADRLIVRLGPRIVFRIAHATPQETN